MDPEVVLAKLESLRRCVTRIEEKTPTDVAVLKNDYDTQDIVSINLERAVQISVDISSHILATFENPVPKTMSQAFVALSDMDVISTELAERLRKAVGFRNISVHEYEDINWDIVFSICTKNLDDFRNFARAVLDQL